MNKYHQIISNSLFVGANYHPHDWKETRWIADLKLMKEASFNFIRIGHLCWDSFEPEEGVFDFQWMERFLDLCKEYELSVFMDLPTRPAPLWLHLKYPTIDIVAENGNRLNAVTRYMEDVGDPGFQYHALLLTSKMAHRFGKHDVLIGFGLCNELGSGYLSYSESARVRFTTWLKKKYGDISTLNKAWNTQRWSRKATDFESIFFPVAGNKKSPPESYLDMRRFFSDEIISYITAMKDVVEKEAPGVATSTNHWAEHPQVGFDYLKSYRDFVEYPGIGFYPGIYPEDRKSLMGACFHVDHRISESPAPMWCLEFQTGTFGAYAPHPGVLRMYAFLSLIYRSQVICAWTWRSMLGGEEQYFFGLLDHDGTPSRKYDEFKSFSEEFRTLSDYAFPLKTDPEVALAYSFESKISTGHNGDFYKQKYMDQILALYGWFFNNNIDLNVVDLRNIQGEYKLLVIAEHNVMDRASADSIREFVSQGGTVIMTSQSAVVNENNTVFSEPLPGRLSDVFGIEIRGFQRFGHHVPSVNEGGISKTALNRDVESIEISFDSASIKTETEYFEIIKTTGAETYASLEYLGISSPIVTVNKFGLGDAVYIGLPAENAVVQKVLKDYTRLKSVSVGPETPNGIVARKIDSKHSLFINTTGDEKQVRLEGKGFGKLGCKAYDNNLPLRAYEVEFIEFE